MLLCVSAAVEERDTWDAMLDALDAVSPLVDDARPGLAYLDMHGIEGSAGDWIARVREALAVFGHSLRIGAGSNKIAASAAAHLGDATVCEPGTERAMLAPLPLTLLEIDPAAIERLRLLGIERLRDLARLPHGPFVRRFGAAAASWHELARGIDRRPFVPRAQSVAIEAAIFGEGRASDEAQVFFALRMLLARICADLGRSGKCAGALHLAIELEDAADRAFDVPLATPTADERALFDLLRAKLEGATFEAAIVGLRLQALRLEEGGEEQSLFASDLDPQRVAVTLARLEAALGASVVHAKTRDAHRLEERFTYEPFQLKLHPCHPEEHAQRASRRAEEHAQRASRRAEEHAQRASRRAKDEGLVPQLRLQEVREIPVQMRGGEPAVVDRRTVRRCAGPWRIDERPHEPQPVSRDEYDVVLDDGTFARIYHQGAHWYLRGVYE